MTNSTDLMQLYILLSYEKLQRSTISQHQRPIEASLRNRLLVWRFLKKIENEPITTINYEQEFFTNNSDNNTLEDDNSWILGLNTNFHDDMDIESDLVNVVSNNEINSINNSTYETMNIDQTSDVNLLLKRAIGAERRQKPLTDNLYFNEDNNNNDNNTNLPQISQSNTFEESEQFFHDLCAELTNTTAALVSSSTTNILNFSSSAEQTLIH